jgi:alpha-beta hydrolase superfamily lysophospholipase
MTEMQSEPFEISTADHHTIHGTEWRTDGDTKGIIQLFHGLGEHHRRYERFARFATARGFSVFAHDHRGHGPHAEEPGHFADSGGWQLLIEDGLLVNDFIREQCPERSIVLLGHSMGSYIAQQFAMFHDDRISALILSGSTRPQLLKLLPGRLIAYIESLRLGKRGKSALLDKLGFGDFNKPFQPARTELDWLSRDAAEVDAYIADPLCGGPYSCGLWLDLLRGLQSIRSDNELLRIRSDLPILLTGGENDPVGGDKGITQLALHYAQTMHGRLSVKIYPEGRHEMLNETNRDEVTEDFVSWIETHLPAVAGT